MFLAISLSQNLLSPCCQIYISTTISFCLAFNIYFSLSFFNTFSGVPPAILQSTPRGLRPTDPDRSSSTERVRIVSELQDRTVTSGEDAVFVCELSHMDVSEGEWWLCSSPLQRNEMNQMTFRGRQQCLVLTMTTPDETGEVAFVIGEERTSAQLLVVPRVKGRAVLIQFFPSRYQF